jgi:hypothetical protein
MNASLDANASSIRRCATGGNDVFLQTGHSAESLRHLADAISWSVRMPIDRRQPFWILCSTAGRVEHLERLHTLGAQD